MTRGTGSGTGRAGGVAEGTQAGSEAEVAAPAAPTARGDKPGKRGDELRQSLVIELHTLRLQAQDAVEQYTLRVNAQLAEVLRLAEGEGTAGEKPRRLPAKLAAAMLARLRDVKLKPKKGRAKDLVRIQELVEELALQLPHQE
jgi:hypothetical protein